MPYYDPTGDVYNDGPQYGCLQAGPNIKHRFLVLVSNYLLIPFCHCNCDYFAEIVHVESVFLVTSRTLHLRCEVNSKIRSWFVMGSDEVGDYVRMIRIIVHWFHLIKSVCYE